MSKDIHNSIAAVRVISPISPAATGTIAGQVIDMANFNSCEFVIQSGAQTTGGITVTPVVKSGSATGALTAVADANLLGTEAAAALDGAAGANGVTKIGYVGNDRYVTCDLVVTGAATGVYAVSAVKGSPRKAPVV
jgi:hypothetical protein